MSTFVERYRKTLVFKSLDVEPLIDRYFHRPIAALVAALLIHRSIRPNQVTLMGIAFGAVGLWLLYLAFFGARSHPYLWLGAGFFYFMAVVFDCVDGQLARATGASSRAGRILDGIADVLVLLPAYVVVGFGIWEHFGAGWFVVTAVAGGSTWMHCLVFDRIKNQYLAQTIPGAGGAQGAESVAEVRRELEELRRRGSIFDAALLRIYLVYLGIQNRLTGSTPSTQKELTSQQVERFRETHRSTIFATCFLDLGSHMFLLYGSIALMVWSPMPLLVTQVAFATVFNLLMVVVLWRAKGF